MPSPEILDFERLLSPVPGENPAGIDLREDLSPAAVYHRIKDCRSAARAAERSQVFGDQPAEGRPDWRPLLDLVPDVLAEQSKDLELTAWLIEALVRLRGYAGLRDGFRLARELTERFWDQLYPRPDEDGISTRVAPLAGLNGQDSEGTLVRPIVSVPILAIGSDRPLTIADVRHAASLERIEDPEKRAQRIAQGGASRQMLEEAASETPTEHFRLLLDDLAECREEFEKLGQVLDEKCGHDESGFSLAPPTSAIREALETCSDAIKHLAQGRLDAPAESASRAMTASGPTAMISTAGPVQTREEAFRALLQVAEYFKRTEPHSPIAYALEQAVRWGRMSLPELLTELIPEESARSQLFKLVGIQTPPETQDHSDS